MNKLKIADKAAANIIKIKIVDIRCLEPDAIKIISVLFSRNNFEMIFQGEEKIAKEIEKDDTFD
jgi:hypothetical protein